MSWFRKLRSTAFWAAVQAAMREPVALVLRSLGWGPLVLSALSSLALGMWAWLTGQPGPIIATIAIGTFAGILIIIRVIVWIYDRWFNDRNHVPPLTARDSEVRDALFWIVDSSAWMRWQDAQRLANNGRSLGEWNKMNLAESVFRMRAENSEVTIRGRRRDHIEYETISSDFWKVTYLDVQPDPKSLWRVTVRARSGLSKEAMDQIPDYVSLQVESQKIQEFWPKNDAKLDALTKELLRKAARQNLLNALRERIVRWHTASTSALKRLVRRDILVRNRRR